ERHAHAEHQHLTAVTRGKSRGERTHDDDIIAGHSQIADDDLPELGEPVGGEDRAEIQALEHGQALIGSCSRRNPRSTWRPSSCRAGTASRRWYPSASGCGATPT